MKKKTTKHSFKNPFSFLMTIQKETRLNKNGSVRKSIPSPKTWCIQESREHHKTKQKKCRNVNTKIFQILEKNLSPKTQNML